MIVICHHAQLYPPTNTISPEMLTSEYAKWCKHERERLAHQREILSSGACRMGYNFGSGWVDSTSETLSELDNTIAELDRLIGDRAPAS